MNNTKHSRGQHSYGSEFVITSLLLGGIALIVSDIPFHIMIQNFIQILGNTIVAVKQFFMANIIQPYVQMELSDLVGALLITVSSGLLVVQIRKRIICTAYESSVCPVCDSKLHRIHRSRWQLGLSKVLFLSSGFYRCEKCQHSSLHFYPKTTHFDQG
ncbi:MAG: hypothetical protein H8E26_15910 [FCB group bacterium]|nr:hypothetical protein [FCB group bacterium]MBL7123226.1 hypothetical protein [Candidatus Neomarinimicrobiota bacterium]